MVTILGENSPLSDHVKEWAEQTRDESRGYRNMRNILGLGLVGATGGLNATETVNSLSEINQIKFSAVGLAIAGVSALGMEVGRRRLEKRAKNWDAHADELSRLGL